MTDTFSLTGAAIFDGHKRHEHSALLVSDGHITGIVPEGDIPHDFEVEELDGGLLAPGLVDLQVNGGGGVLFNEQTSLSGIKTICDAHTPFGTTALLPTLITDIPDVTKRALEAGFEATERSVPGFLGLHLEGPYLDTAKRGAHRADFIRPMSDKDLIQLCDARKHLQNLMVTVAPESVSDEQIAELTNVNIKVSLGHTNTSASRTHQVFEAGAVCATHLFNAMSGLTHREPGLVGAVLNIPHAFAGLIADGHHVHPDAINIALRSKTGDGKIFLVTDAMSTIGTDQTEFSLNGRTVYRAGGKLTLEDGTLAGADLDMISAVRFIIDNTSVDEDEALRMASFYPAKCLGISPKRGQISAGSIADLVELGENLSVKTVWRRGVKCFQS